jgi:hypothetical protein
MGLDVNNLNQVIEASISADDPKGMIEKMMSNQNRDKPQTEAEWEPKFGRSTYSHLVNCSSNIPYSNVSKKS